MSVSAAYLKGHTDPPGKPAFSYTVPDQFTMVYTASSTAPTGSIHQKNLSPSTAATKPTTLVTTSKQVYLCICLDNAIP
ncbi:Os02g0775050 [Oryza sativa Japonica Group]|uniref:Os02g0775050 protein n=1 Tax=Oryza sativa subsp. japonica TaxID=39947 RepID=A0A0P0VQ71_ORYSJ|nr:hypothetical protein EE612_013973 [Oryza sativa]BAS81160.1 Os02g0775050 [Oryza sativa Japonica Group]